MSSKCFLLFTSCQICSQTGLMGAVTLFCSIYSDLMNSDDFFFLSTLQISELTLHKNNSLCGFAEWITIFRLNNLHVLTFPPTLSALHSGTNHSTNANSTTSSATYGKKKKENKSFSSIPLWGFSSSNHITNQVQKSPSDTSVLQYSSFFSAEISLDSLK